ncbi:MAG: endonuclease/exonuclease/phosphatase family protein [Streptosporangiales bacterium]|nr:endonuclease/exonuclease/phosphatase family protein [Streptosporangiales bacterium]
MSLVSTLAATAAGLLLTSTVTPMTAAAGPAQVRFATFNASLNRASQGELVQDLGTRDDAQARNVAEIIQRNRPDVLLVNEFDHDADGEAAELFQRNYLSVGQRGAHPIEYPYRYVAPSNTGVPTGFDLDHDGRAVTTVGEPGYGNDAHGFGDFPGQYGMVVYSKHPIDDDRVRTFQEFRWKDIPGAELPTDPETGEPWYGDDVLDVLRLSSKSHWDLPIRVGARTVHLLAAHPTPPTFDGAEDRNGRRNHDEIRFWADYVTPGAGDYIYDDAGDRGGLAPGAQFVIAGDYNADPYDGDSYDHAARQFTEHPLIDARNVPTSEGAVQAAELQGGANAGHDGDPANDTADFGDAGAFGPGNLRVDYVLPSRGLPVAGTAVFWPTSDDPLARLVWPADGQPPPSSDHRLVWLDVRT